MLFAQTLVAFAAAALVAASPAVRDDGLTCYFIMTPKPELDATSLQTSINYAVGHTIGENWPNHSLTDENSLVRHNDGTFDVASVITVDGVSKADVSAFVKTWGDKTLDGLAVQWYVDASTCVDSA